MPTRKIKRRAIGADDVALEPVPLVPVQTTFRHMDPSPAVAARVDAEVQKLRRYFDRIGHCHVVIIAPVQHHRDRQYAVHLELAVPRRVLAIRWEPTGAATRPAGKHTGRTGAHRDIYVVIRAVFDAARRQLEDYVRRSRDPA